MIEWAERNKLALAQGIGCLSLMTLSVWFPAPIITLLLYSIWMNGKNP
jgi:hypothetical protein